MLDNIGGSELLVVVLVIFLFFGPKKLPEFGKTVGKMMREFRNTTQGIRRDIENATKPD
jgi:sec-independent protein translocase protein TatA